MLDGHQHLPATFLKVEPAHFWDEADGRWVNRVHHVGVTRIERMAVALRKRRGTLLVRSAIPLRAFSENFLGQLRWKFSVMTELLRVPSATAGE